jgi:GT2 family glycosyltransferase
MVNPWFSIVVPTTCDLTVIKPPTVLQLERELIHRLGKEGELIIVRDLWGNANTARNVGITASRGIAICVMDDDINLDCKGLLELLKVVRDDRNVFFISLDPHFIIVNREVLLNVGGYDERFRPCMGDDVELMLRLERMGLKKIFIQRQDLKVEHLQHPRDRSRRYQLNQKHLTWAYLEHSYLPLRKLIWRKNPLEVARRVKWVLEWLLYRRYQRRSILSKR